jgi:hypothetical protein
MNSAGPQRSRPYWESLAGGRGRKSHSTRGESCERLTTGAKRAIGRLETRDPRRSFQCVRWAEAAAPLIAFFNSRVLNSLRISRGLLPAARNWATSGGSLTSGSDPSLQAETASIAAASGQAANRCLVMMPLNCESPRWARARRSASDGLRRYRAAAGARRGGDAI